MKFKLFPFQISIINQLKLMSKNKTKKSCYQSKYGDCWVSPAQYITEVLCQIIANAEKKSLGDKFWNDKYWTKIFRRQVGLANKLLKDYPISVILSSLRDRQCWKIRSLGAMWLLQPILEENMKKYNSSILIEKDIEAKEKTSTIEQPRRVSGGKKSILARLKECEKGQIINE
jgi:hypothetical protein